MKRINLEPNEVLFEKGDNADTAYLILDGTVDISGVGFQSNLGKLDIFGEAGLIGKNRMATVKAQTFCALLEFTVEELRNAIKTDPETAEYMMEAMVRRLAQSADALEKALVQSGKVGERTYKNRRFGVGK